MINSPQRTGIANLPLHSTIAAKPDLESNRCTTIRTLILLLHLTASRPLVPNII